MFNSYRVKYSPETHKLLKVLMDEAKISGMHRQKMKEVLDKGDPLPVIRRQSSRPPNVDDNLFDMKKNYYFMRRTRDQIRHSGAYERENYRLLQPLVDKEKEKERLGNIMAFGKGGRSGERADAEKTRRKRDVVPAEERIEELILEIQERLLFLDEMTEFGKRKVYEDAIKQEIASKLRELEKLDKNTARKYSQALEQPQRLRTNMDEVLCWGEVKGPADGRRGIVHEK